VGTQNSDLEVNIRGKDDLSPALNQIESRLIRFVGAVGAGIAALKITSAPIVAAVQLERELANVRKTTNFTATEMEQLNREILRLSTTVDVAANDLAKIAAAAGQQGLGREGVAGVVAFTESVARMSSVLDITAEEAASGIGKIVNVFKIPLKEIETAVSTFNEVSNNSTAKGAELLDVVKRIGDAAGRLNLQQSISLAATGIDFGQSPEVVGTAFAKVFSSLNQKAVDFGRLLYGTTTNATQKWLAELDTDGLKAFKHVLEGIRKLNAVDQQNVIVKMFGGGRIGALVNKLVQDSANVVLDRNFANAQKGAQGFSAIQEQATVLNTVAAQAKITLNTLIDAGIEASSQLLGPLVGYLKRLQDGLKSAEFRSFLNAVGKAVGQTLGLIDKFISGVAQLGIVWTNFLPLIQAFIGFKLVEVLAGVTARFLGLSSGLKSISKDSAAAADGINAAAQAASTKKFSGSWFSEKLGYKELYDEIKRTGEAKRAQIAIDAEVAAASAKATAAQAAASRAALAEAPASRDLRGAGLGLNSAQNNARQEMQKAADALFAIEQQKAQRIQQITAESEARRAAIVTEFETRRQEIAATGTRVGLTQAKRDRDTALAEEEAGFQRRLRGVQAYWARREAAEAAGATAAVNAATAAQNAAQARYDAANARFNSVTSTAGNTAAGAAAAAATLSTAQQASAALATTNAALAAQGGQLGIISVLWARMGLVWRAAIGVLGTLATAIGFLGRIALSAFGWITLIYTLADALGILKPLTSLFKDMAEKLGLVSKEKAQAALAAEQHAEKLRQEAQAALDATKAYDDLRRGRSGAEVKQSIENLANTAADPNAPDSQRQSAQDQFLKAGQAIQAALAESQQTFDAMNANAAAKAATEVEAARQAMERTKQEVLKFQDILDKRTASQGNRKANIEEQRLLDTLSGAATAAAKSYQDATKAAEDLKQKQAGISVNYQQVSADAKSFNEVVQSQFTPESASLFEKYISKYASLSDAVKNARDETAKLSSDKQGKDKADIAVIDARITRLKEEAAANSGAMEAIRAAFDEELKGLLALPGLSENALNSLKNLKRFFDRDISSVPTILAAIKNADASNLTGTRAPKPAPATTGKDSFNPKVTGQESLARRLRRAELELAKAQNAAEANLAQEGYRQLQSIADEAYDRGLVTIKNYYDARKELQLKAIDAEIKQRQLDITAVNFEAAKPGADAAEKKRAEAERARLNGDIAVLQERKKGIQDDTDRDITRANKQFTEATLSEQAKLNQQGLIPADTVQVFTQTLDSLRAAQKDRLNKLKTEGQEALAQNLDRSSVTDAASAAVTATGNKLADLMNKVNKAKQDIADQQTAGILSSAEAAKAVDDSITSTTPKMVELADELQTFLDGITDVQVRGSSAFKSLQDQVTGFKQSIVGLNLEVGNTARTINRDLSTQFADVIVKMKGGIDGIRAGLSSLAQVVGNQVLTQATKSIGDEIFKTIGGVGGKGGIGGAITDALGVGSKADGSSANPYFVKQASEGGKDIAETVAEGTAQTGGFFENLGANIGNYFQNSDNSFVRWIGTLLSFLGTSFTSLISAIFTSSASSDASSSAGSVLSAIAHTGGVIGSPYLQQRMVAPAIFNDAARYHTGGVIGLKPNEVPIVAMKGEEMLTADDPRHRNNIGKGTGEGASGSGTVNVWIVTEDQKPSVTPSDIVLVVSDNISRGGSIKKLIQSVQMGK
jgi:TP901 family phage tail tape measure protein